MVWLGRALCVLSDLAFGLWNETRIFAELSLVLAVTAAVQFEAFVGREWIRALEDRLPELR